MKFHEHESYYSYAKGSATAGAAACAADYYANRLSEFEQSFNRRENLPLSQRAPLHARHLLHHAESRWYEQLRPYYKVWPGITDALCRIPLDVPARSMVSTSGPMSLLVRMPVGMEPTVNGKWRLRIVLVTYLPTSSRGEPYFMVYASAIDPAAGEVTELSPQVIPTTGDETIEQFLERAGGEQIGLDAGCGLSIIRNDYSLGLTRMAIRVGISVLLLANDPSVVKPDVLAADREAYDRTGDPKYIERAKKKGIVGWRIGEEYEKCPHFRRPHLALRHTGKGGAIPKIVPVKACVVKRDKLTRVPTGYITPDGIEVEPKA